MYALLGGLLLASSLGVVLHFMQRGAQRRHREHHIRNYVFSKTLLDALLTAQPQLEERDAYLVADALRIFFSHPRAHRTCGDWNAIPRCGRPLA